VESAQPLFAACYAELHHMARRHVMRRARDLTIGATGLLHEAYLDMVSRDSVFEDRARFLAYASRVMRTRIVDHVRRRRAQKRGSAVELSRLEREPAAPPAVSEDGSRIRCALEALAATEPLLSDIVDLHFFGGFTYAEIAALRGLSERTVQRSWQKARAYLQAAVRHP
jgi:RNA polymerase sigma factor (TIGR02999 family)